MNGPAPLDADDFARTMQALGLSPARGCYAVAVSGGADSLALMLLAHQWTGAVGATFDHGLRPGFRAEADALHTLLSEKGIAHTLLGAGEDPPQSNQQEWARKQRYAALRDWCREKDIPYLLLAHHLDDQAETVVMRLLRGSGVDGLAGMQAITRPWADRGPALVRPLLDVPKSRLVATVRQAGLDWIEDPANRDEKHLRTRVRALMENLKVEGFDASRMARTAAHMTRARVALDWATSRAAAQVIRQAEAGSHVMDMEGFSTLPLDVQYRILRGLLTHYGQARGPRLEKLERLHVRLAEADFAGATAHGTLFAPGEGGTVRICREAAAIGGPLRINPGEERRWDGRVMIRYSRGPGPVEVIALGQTGDWPDTVGLQAGALPGVLAATLPAVIDRGKIVAVPDLNYTEEAYDVYAEYLDIFGGLRAGGE